MRILLHGGRRRDAALAPFDGGAAQAVSAAALGPEPARRDLRAGAAALARRLRRDLRTPRRSRAPPSFRTCRPTASWPSPSGATRGPRSSRRPFGSRPTGDPVTAAVPTDQTVRDDEAFRRALSAADEEADGAAVVILAVPPDAAPKRISDTSRCEDGAVLALRREARTATTRGRSPPRAATSGTPASSSSGPRACSPRRAASRGSSSPASSASCATGAAGRLRGLPDISIDFAVMEKAAGVRAVPLDAGWSDVGTWRSVRELRGATDGRATSSCPTSRCSRRGCATRRSSSGEEGVLVLPFEREGELRAAVAAHRRRARSLAPRQDDD